MKIAAKVLQTDEIVEIVGDLLVGADGCLSSVLQTFLPNLKLRYVKMKMEHNAKFFVSPLIYNFIVPYEPCLLTTSLSCVDILVIVLGEGSLIFRRMRIQRP